MEAAKIRQDGLGMAGRVVYGIGGIWGVWGVWVVWDGWCMCGVGLCGDEWCVGMGWLV